MSVALERALLDVAAQLDNMPRECARGGAPLVEWKRDIVGELRRLARRASGEGPETVFRTGTVSGRGRSEVRVERRAPRAA